MKHVVLICHTTKPFNGKTPEIKGLRGVETTVVELAHALADLGYQVTAISPTTEEIEYKGVVWKHNDQLPNIEADIFISCNDARIFDKLSPRSKKHARKIIWLHNPLLLEKAFRKKQFFKLIQHRPDLVCVGHYLLNKTNKLLAYKKRYVIGHGISSPFLTPAPNPISKRSNKIVWLSQPQRGLEKTLKLWTDYILPAIPDAEFHLFGLQDNVCGLNETICKKQRIHIYKRTAKPALAEFLNQSKLLLFPGALDETFCLAAAEAQAMGVPVVTQGIGSLSERVTNNVNGIIEKDDQAFAQAAIKILKDNDLWQRLSQGALENRNTLTWPEAAKQWQVLIDND